MKSSIFFLFILSTFILAACGGETPKNEHEGHDMAKPSTESSVPATLAVDSAIKQIAITYTSIDPKATKSFKAIVDHYLHVKNALVNDDSKQASNGAEALAEALGDLDKSLLSSEQKNAFDPMVISLTEHAEHIEKNADNIKHQRSHFEEMSMNMYALVKAFGAGRTIYHVHCPMAHDNQGAMWISEAKEVKNPYFGSEMPTCGNVVEVIN